MQPLSWDEFRLVKAIADTRTLAGAAETLGLNHSTVFRRLNAVEDQLGSRLFERSRTGYALTAAGEDMLELADHMAERIVAFERKVAGRDVKPSGELRVTTADTLFATLLAPILIGFRQNYPDITVEVIVDNRNLNLSRRDADVALRAAREPPETLVGRRIASVAWSAFAPLALAKPDGSLPALDEAPWIGFADPLSRVVPARWLEDNVPASRIALRLNAVASLFAAAEAGLGYCLLPCFVGNSSARLTRITRAEIDSSSGLWLLTHPDLRHSARVRAFLDYAGRELAKQRRPIEGE
jgi:DNA-binding transcriptional LysR family regulator